MYTTVYTLLSSETVAEWLHLLKILMATTVFLFIRGSESHLTVSPGSVACQPSLTHDAAAVDVSVKTASRQRLAE